MKIEDLNNKAEEKKELTEEEQKQMQEFAEQWFSYQNRYYLKEIRKYIQRKGITLTEAIEEVNNKTSKLPFKARCILLYTKPEILERKVNNE